MQRQNGFSLIELLVATAVVGLVSFYMLGGVIASNRAYSVVDQVAESQQGMRAIAELIERDLRHAGMMIPPAGAVCAVDNTGTPDVLYVSDAAAIDPGDDFASYSGAQVATASNVTVPNDTLTVDSLIIEPAPPTRAAYDNDGNGSLDTDFQVGGGAIVFDINNPDRGTACGRVSAINPGALTISIQFVTQALGTGTGAQLAVVPAHVYIVQNGDQLMRDGRLLSDGVDDIQFAFFFDVNDNAVIDANEMQGVSGANYVAQDTDVEPLREVRLNLVMRTRMEDREFEGQEQQWENRAGAPLTDGFRRRSYTSSVRLRNLVDRAGT